jgi:hypothetical protein
VGLISRALLTAACVALLALAVHADASEEQGALIAERAREIGALLARFDSAGSEEEKADLATLLGAVRAAEAAGPLVASLVELHRRAPSPFRDPDSPGHGLAVALVEALKKIGRPGLEPFLEALATWDGYALDLTWAFAAVHEEEGILVLRHRARSEADSERRARLQAAAWFSRLRAPNLQDEPDAALPESPVSTPRTR